MRLGFSHCGVLKQTPKVEQNRVLAVKAKTLADFKAGMRGLGLEAFRVRVEDTLKAKRGEQESDRIRRAVAEATNLARAAAEPEPEQAVEVELLE